MRQYLERIQEAKVRLHNLDLMPHRPKAAAKPKTWALEHFCGHFPMRDSALLQVRLDFMFIQYYSSDLHFTLRWE